jgi:tryptophan-rich sensory protein
MKKHTKIILLSILIAETAGALSAWSTREEMKTFTNMIAQPPLSPPPLLFPIVWSILYALMGYGSAKIWMSAPSLDRTRGLVLYASQLVFNFFWSLIFFNIQAFGFSFFWLLTLWGLVLLMTLAFRKTDPLAAKLQIPYLLWLTFAVYLNLGVWYLNA